MKLLRNTNNNTILFENLYLKNDRVYEIYLNAHGTIGVCSTIDNHHIIHYNYERVKSLSEEMVFQQGLLDEWLCDVVEFLQSIPLDAEVFRFMND